MNQRVGSHQTLNLWHLALGLPSLQICEKLMFGVKATQCMMGFVIAA